MATAVTATVTWANDDESGLRNRQLVITSATPVCKDGQLIIQGHNFGVNAPHVTLAWTELPAGPPTAVAGADFQQVVATLPNNTFCDNPATYLLTVMRMYSNPKYPKRQPNRNDLYVFDVTFVGHNGAGINYDAVDQAITDLQSQAETADAEVNSVKGQIDALDARVDTLETQAGTLTTTVGDHTNQLSGLSTTVGDHTTQLGTLDGRVGSLEAGFAGLNTDIGNLNASFSTLDGRVGSLEGDVTALNSSVSTLNSDVGTLNSGLGTLSTLVTNQGTQLANHETRITS